MDFDDGLGGIGVQNALTRDVRQAAAKQNNSEYMSLWAGQSLRLATNKSLAEIIHECVQQAHLALGKITSSEEW